MKKAKFCLTVVVGLLLVSFSFATVSQAANQFGYDPEWMSDVPKIGGYVDVYFTYSENEDGQYNGLEADKFDFTVDRLELFIQHRTEKMPWAEGYFEVSTTGLSDDTEINLDEAYLRVAPPALNGVTLTGGVYDVPIGIGPNENIDIWNWQFKMTNLLVVPWSFTGGMAEYSIGDVDLTAMVANGWGYSEAYGILPVGRADVDEHKTYAGRIGISPEFLNTGISVVSGREYRTLWNGVMDEEDVGQTRTLYDWDFRLEKRPAWLNAFDIEAWYLEVDNTPQVDSPMTPWAKKDANAKGAVVQTNFQTHWESLSLSFAYEVIHEEDGIVFGPDPNTEVALKDQTRWSFEFTPIWAIGDNIIVALTWRGDWSNENVFTKDRGKKVGTPTGSTWLAAWEWYYYF
jgi:hypothetical protein